MSQDNLSHRLDQLLSDVNTELSDPDSDNPPPSAGGVPLMEIFDLPLASTPPEFQLPPPSEEEMEALARIQSSLFSGVSSMPAIQSGEDNVSAPSFAAPTELFETRQEPSFGFNHVPEKSFSVLESPVYLPYLNDVVAGRNSVPSGIFRLQESAKLYPVKGTKDMGLQCSAEAFLISDKRFGELAAVFDWDESADVDQPRIYTCAFLNSIPVSGGYPDSPYFLCLVASSSGSGLYCVRLSDVYLYRPRFDTDMFNLLRAKRQQPLYFFINQMYGPLVEKSVAVPAVFYPKNEISQYSSADLFALLLRFLMTKDVNTEDKTRLSTELGQLSVVDRQRKRRFHTISEILSKYLRT